MVISRLSLLELLELLKGGLDIVEFHGTFPPSSDKNSISRIGFFVKERKIPLANSASICYYVMDM